jgi:hypothetical protein
MIVYRLVSAEALDDLRHYERRTRTQARGSFAGLVLVTAVMIATAYVANDRVVAAGAVSVGAAAGMAAVVYLAGRVGVTAEQIGLLIGRSPLASGSTTASGPEIDLTDAQLAVGRALLQENREDAALHAFQWVAATRQSPEAYTQAGWLLARAGESDLAAKAFAQAVRAAVAADPSHKSPVKAAYVLGRIEPQPEPDRGVQPTAVAYNAARDLIGEPYW